MDHYKEEDLVVYPINDNIKANGYIQDMNRFQYNCLLKFKEKILKEKLLEDFSVNNDVILLKFLRSKKFDVEKAYQMFAESVKWKIKEKVEEIELMRFEELLLIKKFYPHAYHKTDKLGRPIYIELLGKINIKELFEITSEDRMIKYGTREYQRSFHRYDACSRAFGTLIEEGLNILDMKGVSIGMFTGKVKKFLAIATKLNENYYPESCFKSFMINTSSMFSFVWSLIKGFLNEKTRNKVVILKSNFRDVLLEYIDIYNLPSIFGGECTCSHIPGGCMFSDIGPWNPEGGLLD